MSALPLPDVDRLKALFAFDEATGELRWRARDDVPPNWNGHYAGTVAGTTNAGRVTIIVHGRRFKAHRVIWKMVTGEEPSEIDHIDGNPMNNRISNLRPATREQNMRNVRGRAASGVKGVSLHRLSGLWRARVRVDGKEICEYHKSLEEAAAAYAALARFHYGAFARLA